MAKEAKTKATQTTKLVKNKNLYRVELIVDEKVVVLFPGDTVQVPLNFSVPTGMGIFEV